ncbi:hypothetical protein GE09DRAFT_1292491 [Coniochaeta sp. 2T2.1]|nr:hypothetical protein GE09DRAFT_1292491 [Coniochaeta sp. 2T2.1]
MGNTVSTEQEYESSQSNVEEWPPIKHWTAERAREEGLAPLTTVQDHSCLGCHKEQHGSEPPVAPETHSPQFQVEDFSNNPPCPGDWTCRFCGLLSSRHFRVCLICFSPSPHERSSRHMWLTQELTRLKKVARSPNWHVLAQPTALSPGRKQEPAASYGLDGRTSDGHKKSLKRVAKHAALDSEEYNEVFDSQESSPNLTTPLNTGKNGTLHSDSKGRALACMNCLRRMASTRLKRPFLGCHNQPGRDDNARCQNCKQAAQGCHLPPVELQDAARALQAAWEDARHNLIISGRLSCTGGGACPRPKHCELPLYAGSDRPAFRVIKYADSDTGPIH